MKALLIIFLIGIVLFALYRKWQAIPAQNKHMLKLLLSLLGAGRQNKRTSQHRASPRTEQEHTTYSTRPDERQVDRSSHQSAHHMLACSQCGVHVPKSEGYEKNGQFYCMEHHLP
jgi:formylmethanofuran dehydrogenase subunit E